MLQAEQKLFHSDLTVQNDTSRIGMTRPAHSRKIKWSSYASAVCTKQAAVASRWFRIRKLGSIQLRRCHAWIKQGAEIVVSRHSR